MAQGKGQQTRRTVGAKPKLPDPVETTQEFTGVKPTTFYLCPLCGRSGEDRDRIVQHIAEPHPGGEQA